MSAASLGDNARPIANALDHLHKNPGAAVFVLAVNEEGGAEVWANGRPFQAVVAAALLLQLIERHEGSPNCACCISRRAAATTAKAALERYLEGEAV